MGHLLVARHRHGKFFPFTSWSKSAEIEKRAAVQRGAGNPHDSSQADKRLFVNFISAHQIRVVAKVPQEPAELPECFGSAVEATVEGTALMFRWFENDKPQNIERPLGMPAVEDPIDADQEYTLQDALGIVSFAMQTWNVTLHELTSGCLE